MSALGEALQESMTVEEHLKAVSYSVDPSYVPSEFALEFVAFIKLVNGEDGEENLTPLVHLYMLDTLTKRGARIANLCHRGIAKTTVFGEYLFLYLGVYGAIPGFGKLTLAIYVSDSIDNGVKNMRKNLEFRYENSDFLKEYVPVVRFTDTRWEFRNAGGNVFIVKGYGAKALSLDSVLYTEAGMTTIENCRIGESIYGPNGGLAIITQKSAVFNKPMYRIALSDGRTIKVSEDHINSVVVNTDPNNTVRWEEFDLSTRELLLRPLLHTKKGNVNHRGTSSKSLVFIKNTLPLSYPEKEFSVDPYTLGVILGDGRIKKPDCSVELTTHIDDLATYHKNIPYEFGKGRLDKRNTNTWTQSIRRLGPALKALELGVHGSKKFIPEVYFYGSIQQRLALLQGLMDTDGTVTKTGRTSFCSMSPELLVGVMRLARSLGGTASTNKKPFNTEIWLNLPMFQLERKLQRQRYDRKDQLVAVSSIERIADEPSQCIAIDNDSHQFLTDNYFRTHNTGVRGAKELGTRPQLAVLDDLISDEDARSATVIAAVEDTVYKAVDYALHPKKNLVIWSGTPFNAKDPLYKAVESGAWLVNVFPVCEQYPCAKEDFVGSWPDRFTFDYVRAQYDTAVKVGKVDSFNQELMLRIMSEDDRLIRDEDIQWYAHNSVVKNKERFNFYITTDFATSDTEAADFSVISVWALNHNGDWYWVDGVCKRQLMDQNVHDLFRLAQLWRPQSVGVEVSGQQSGFIPWIQGEMLSRNIYFTLASHGNNAKPGIRPSTKTKKIERFNVAVPLFKAKKMHFPEELKTTPIMAQAMNELSLVSPSGFRSKKDDFCDTIAMLPVITTFRPSEYVDFEQDANGMWAMEDDQETDDALLSYIV